MSTWSTKPDADEESRQIWEDRVRAIWHDQPGLVQAHLLALPGTLERMTFSVWESETDYERFLTSAAIVDIGSAYDHIYLDDEHRPTRPCGAS